MTKRNHTGGSVVDPAHKDDFVTIKSVLPDKLETELYIRKYLKDKGFTPEYINNFITERKESLK